MIWGWGEKRVGTCAQISVKTYYARCWMIESYHKQPWALLASQSRLCRPQYTAPMLSSIKGAKLGAAQLFDK